MAKKQEEKIDIFGSAKVKIKGSKPKDDKEVIYIDGLEPKLLELEFLKAQIKDLEAQLGGVADEIKNISKEKFVELYKRNKSNPNTFLIKDGEGCVMVIPTDRYISIKDEDRVNQLIEEYGDDIITTDGQWVFNTEVLKRNIDAIKQLLMDAKNISNEDKKNLLVNEKSYSISKGYIDKLAQYGSKIGTVLDDIQPVINLKNCGGKMEEGGMMGDDFIATIYAKGGIIGDDIEIISAGGDGTRGYYIYNEGKKAINKSNGTYEFYDDEVEEVIGSSNMDAFYDGTGNFKIKSNKNLNFDYFANGGFLGGIFGGGRTYKKGLAYKLDRAKHNKSEDWEVPMKNRKRRYEDGDMVDAGERMANGGGVGKKSFYSEVKVGNKEEYADGFTSLIILGKTYDFITGEPNKEYQKIASITEDGEIIYFSNAARKDSYSNNFIKGIAKNINKYANGGGVGNIPNNYEGKSPKDIWDSWSKEQRKHFLYDHQSDARDSDEVGGSKGYYYSDDIDKWVEMEWNELPYAMIKNLVFEHTDSGQYAKGGGLKNKVNSFNPTSLTNINAKGSTVRGLKIGDNVRFTKEFYDYQKGSGINRYGDTDYGISTIVWEDDTEKDSNGEFYVTLSNGFTVPKKWLVKTNEKKGSLFDIQRNVSYGQEDYDYANGGGVGEGKKRRFKKIESVEEMPINNYVRMYALHPRSYFVYPKDGDFKNYVYIIEPFATVGLMKNGGGVEILYDVISYDDNDRIVDSYYGVSEQEADEIKKSLEETYESAGVDNYVYIKTSNIKTSKESTEKYNKSVRDLYQRRRFESGQEDDDYANGGGVESVMTDEMCVMQGCVNGEIHCDMLEEIIGSKPEYPYQQVGSIRLKKCYLRPYYKIS